MFASERHQMIFDQLQMHGKVLVKDLSKQFNVSEDCIRKDLKQLEFQGKCKRAYGGATLRESSVDHNVFERKDKDIAAKKEVAKKAFDVLENGETIFLDVSTTNILVAQLLAESDKKLIVISNMIEILQVLAKNSNLTVIGTGGSVNLELNGFIGSVTMAMLSKHNFSKCFIGTTGIDYETNQLTTFDMDDGFIKETVINNSEKSYILMENKKFGMLGTYKYIDIDTIDYIISNDKIEDKYNNYLKEHHVELI